MTASGRKLAVRHLAYLERDGVERDGSRGRLYGCDEKFSGEEFREGLAGEKRQFRFIVSPEDGGQLELTEWRGSPCARSKRTPDVASSGRR
jgi:hypothetical protein